MNITEQDWAVCAAVDAYRADVDVSEWTLNDYLAEKGLMIVAVDGQPDRAGGDGMRDTLTRLVTRHVGAWIERSNPALQLVPVAADQDVRDLVSGILALAAPPSRSALDELHLLLQLREDSWWPEGMLPAISARIAELRKIAAASGNAGERTKPVAWRWRDGNQWAYRSSPPNNSHGDYEPLYTAPPQPAPDAMREAVREAAKRGYLKWLKSRAWVDAEMLFDEIADAVLAALTPPASTAGARSPKVNEEPQ